MELELLTNNLICISAYNYIIIIVLLSIYQMLIYRL